MRSSIDACLPIRIQQKICHLTGADHALLAVCPGLLYLAKKKEQTRQRTSDGEWHTRADAL